MTPIRLCARANAGSLDELLAPITYIVPGQLFALSLAVERDSTRITRALSKIKRTR